MITEGQVQELDGVKVGQVWRRNARRLVGARYIRVTGIYDPAADPDLRHYERPPAAFIYPEPVERGTGNTASTDGWVRVRGRQQPISLCRLRSAAYTLVAEGSVG